MKECLDSIPARQTGLRLQLGLDDVEGFDQLGGDRCGVGEQRRSSFLMTAVSSFSTRDASFSCLMSGETFAVRKWYLLIVMI